MANSLLVRAPSPSASARVHICGEEGGGGRLERGEEEKRREGVGREGKERGERGGRSEKGKWGKERGSKETEDGEM